MRRAQNGAHGLLAIVKGRALPQRSEGKTETARNRDWGTDVQALPNYKGLNLSSILSTDLQSAFGKLRQIVVRQLPRWQWSTCRRCLMPKNEFRKELRLAQFAFGLPNAAATALPTDWGLPYPLDSLSSLGLLLNGLKDCNQGSQSSRRCASLTRYRDVSLLAFT